MPDIIPCDDDTKAVRRLLSAVARMRDTWSETDDDGRADLWRGLHERADAVEQRFEGRISELDRRAALLPDGGLATVLECPAASCCRPTSTPAVSGAWDANPETAADPIAERFARETKHHVLTILHDDGLYRHIRCMAPSPMGSAYWFELITVPGSLTFRGDGESYSFARETDMFGFFRSNPDRLKHRISPDYWAEKLTSNRDAVKTYSPKLFASLVAEHLKEAERGYPGVTAAWAEAIELDYDTGYEESARPALEGFEYRPDGAKPNSEPFRFYDTWEWDLRDFDWWYLWACHAIVWGIAQYDKAEKPVTTITTAEQLRALPVGTVLLDSEGDAWQAVGVALAHVASGGHYGVNSHGFRTTVVARGPFRVLHTPGGDRG